MLTLLDVGACTGQFTDRWLAENPNGRVFCVEPDSANVDVLRQKFEPDSRVQILPVAVNWFGGSQTFYQGTSYTNGSLLDSSEGPRFSFYKKKKIESSEVECLKISDIISRYDIDMESCVLKLDIEGLEHTVLCDLLESYPVPVRIYMEDGCRKTVHQPEWAARIRFFNMVEKKDIWDRVFVEEVNPDPLKNVQMSRQVSHIETGDRIGYIPLKDYYSFKSLHDPSWALERFEEQGINELVRACGFSDAVRDLLWHPSLDGMAFWFEGPFLNRVVPLTVRSRDVNNDLEEIIKKSSDVFESMIQFDTKKSDLVFGIPRMLFIGVDRNASPDNMLIPIAVLAPWRVEDVPGSFSYSTTWNGFNKLNELAHHRYDSKPQFHRAIEFCFMSEENANV